MKKNRNDYIFRGFIRHFGNKPGGLAVDWFGDICDLYFLSHAHSDHFSFEENGQTMGLLDPDFIHELKKRPHAKIYCTEITQEIIRNLPTANRLKTTRAEVLDELSKHFVILKPNETREISFWANGEQTGEKMTVRTIPANHIPGAVMFLFDDGEKRALYTGDFRYDVREENWEMEALKEFVRTYDEVIDYLYLDITCLDIGKLYHPDQNKLPSRQESKEMVCQLIEEIKPRPGSVYIDATPLGAEDMVQAVGEFFNNTADEILSRLQQDFPMTLRTELYGYMLREMKKGPTMEKTNVTDVHIFDKSKFRVSEEIKKDIHRFRATLQWVFCEDALKFGYSYSDKHTWKTWDEDYKLQRVLCSHHSSDFEIRDFLSHLKFTEVFPISRTFPRNYLEGVEVRSSKSATEDEINKEVRRSLRFTLDCKYMVHNIYPIQTIRLKFGRKSVDPPTFRCDMFNVHMKTVMHPVEIPLVISGIHKSVNFAIIPCTEELYNACVDDLIGLVQRIFEHVKKAIVFYSISEDDRNEAWKQRIKDIKLAAGKKMFHINLEKIPEYKTSKKQQDLETTILFETLKNLVRNEGREIEEIVDDWPLPYEFSARKRQYEEGNQLREPESQEIEMEQLGSDADDDQDSSIQDEEPQSQEIEMLEPPIK